MPVQEKKRPPEALFCATGMVSLGKAIADGPAALLHGNGIG